MNKWQPLFSIVLIKIYEMFSMNTLKSLKVVLPFVCRLNKK